MYNSTIYDFLKINRKKTNQPLLWSVICLMFLTLTTMSVKAQNVNIPDPVFKNYLLNNPYINTNGDDEIQESEAQEFTGEIDVSFLFLSDLTGIEAFVNLTKLDCKSNDLTTLNLSSNTALVELCCFDNQLTSLDVSNNTNLEFLECHFNQLTSLDISINPTGLYS